MATHDAPEAAAPPDRPITRLDRLTIRDLLHQVTQPDKQRMRLRKVHQDSSACVIAGRVEGLKNPHPNQLRGFEGGFWRRRRDSTPQSINAMYLYAVFLASRTNVAQWSDPNE
ncbi:MAG: hypothetical protein M0T84_00765 [Betaproteobacteria bacterium]|nr:hypothetical protein [Betaproteobacteria bacterium]